MKSFTKLALVALTIAIGFTACTKDNSATPASSSIKFSNKISTSLKLKDTIEPKVQSSKTVSPAIAPAIAVKRDTIEPK